MLDIYPTNGLSRRAKLPILTTLLGSKDSHFRNSNKFLLVYFQLQWEFSPSLSLDSLALSFLSSYDTPYYIGGCFIKTACDGFTAIEMVVCLFHEGA